MHGRIRLEQVVIKALPQRFKEIRDVASCAAAPIRWGYDWPMIVRRLGLRTRNRPPAHARVALAAAVPATCRRQYRLERRQVCRAPQSSSYAFFAASDAASGVLASPTPGLAASSSNKSPSVAPPRPQALQQAPPAQAHASKTAADVVTVGQTGHDHAHPEPRWPIWDLMSRLASAWH